MMLTMIVRQPNGLYLLYNPANKQIIDWGLSKHEAIRYKVEEAQKLLMETLNYALAATVKDFDNNAWKDIIADASRSDNPEFLETLNGLRLDLDV